MNHHRGPRLMLYRTQWFYDTILCAIDDWCLLLNVCFMVVLFCCRDLNVLKRRSFVQTGHHAVFVFERLFSDLANAAAGCSGRNSFNSWLIYVCKIFVYVMFV